MKDFIVHMASKFTWEKKTGFVEATKIGINKAIPDTLQVKSDKTGEIKQFNHYGSVISRFRRIELIHYHSSSDELSIILLREHYMPPTRDAIDYEKYI